MKRIINLIWDFDGTIMDTYPAIAGTTYNIAKKYGVDVSYDDIYAMTKKTLNQALDVIVPKAGKSRAELFKEYLIEYELYDVSTLTIFPHVEEVLDLIIELGGRNFIMTHREHFSAVKHLEQAGILDKFSYIIGGDDDFKRKPAPDSYLFLKEKFDLKEDNTLAVGDRDIDVLAGSGAGFKGVLYNNQMPIDSVILHINDYLELYEFLKNELKK